MKIVLICGQLFGISRQSPEARKKHNSFLKPEKQNDLLEPFGKSVFEVLLQRNPGAAEEILDFGISTNSQVIITCISNMLGPSADREHPMSKNKSTNNV